jgi:hypothetical protein
MELELSPVRISIRVFINHHELIIALKGEAELERTKTVVARLTPVSLPPSMNQYIGTYS